MNEIPQSARELADDLRAVLKHLMRKLRQEGENHPSGLSFHQLMLLARLESHPGIGVAELARLENLQGPTMSSHVKAMEGAGLVGRAVDKADRRRAGLYLTDHGRIVFAEIRERRRDWLACELAQLPAEGAAALRQALTYLKGLGE